MASITRRNALEIGAALVASSLWRPAGASQALPPERAGSFTTHGLREATFAELNRRVCSDDRPDLQTSGAVQGFGADGSHLVNGLAVAKHLREKRGMPVDYDQVVAAWLRACGGSANVCYHTDTETPGKDGMGCAFCREAQQYPDEHGMDRDLGKLFVQTLLDAKAFPDVLFGPHDPSAFIVMRHRRGIGKDGSGAMILDHRVVLDGTPIQAFIYSADLVEWHLRRLAHEMLTSVKALGSFSEEELLALLRDREHKNAQRTLGVVGKGLPSYLAVVDHDHGCKIQKLVF
jgi:hypothetical protein